MVRRDELIAAISGYSWARVVQVAAQLGLADMVAEGVDTAATLSAKTGIDAWRLTRFMRMLTALGLFTRDGECYALTDEGRLLVTGVEDGVGDLARMHYHVYPALEALEDCLRTGKAGYEARTGRTFFDAMTEMPEVAATFDRVMNLMHEPETKAIVEKFDFGTYRCLMDVGGGNGELLLAVLAAHPMLQGRLFDLPHVVERASEQIAASSVASRCESIGGSFFDPLPGGADAILLRHVIHDWDLDQAVQILARCREAVAPRGTVLVAEALIEDADHPTTPIRLDLSMMALVGGAERTREEYGALLAEAGLAVTDTTEIMPTLGIIEARPT